MLLARMMGLGISQQSGLSALTVSWMFFDWKWIIFCAAVNCTHPPEKAAAGTWEWNGNFNYGTEVLQMSL